MAVPEAFNTCLMLSLILSQTHLRTLTYQVGYRKDGNLVSQPVDRFENLCGPTLHRKHKIEERQKE